jgi:hypothetical protein
VIASSLEFVVFLKQSRTRLATSERSELNVGEGDDGRGLHRVKHVDDLVCLERLAEVETLHLVADLSAQ